MSEISENTGKGEQMKKSEKSEKMDTKYWFYIIACALVAIFIIVIILVPKIMPEQSKGNEVEYNYFKFKKTESGWMTQVMYKERLLQPIIRYLPEEVEEVPIKGQLEETFGEDPIYLTFDPTQGQEEFQTITIAVSEMGMNLVQGMEKQIESGCTKNETEACINRTIINCDDANRSVIFFNPIGEPEVMLEGKCIELRGKQFDLIKSADKVLYTWYGILKRNIILPELLPQN